MCGNCDHSWDDHNLQGLCLMCLKENGPCRPNAPVPSPLLARARPDEITLWTCPGPPPVPVTLPGTTLARDAALRIAETLGLAFPGAELSLVDVGRCQVIAPDSIIAGLSGRAVILLIGVQRDRPT